MMSFVIFQIQQQQQQQQQQLVVVLRVVVLVMRIYQSPRSVRMASRPKGFNFF